MGGEGRGGGCRPGERGKEREERKEHRLFQPHDAVERGREETEGGGTQQHIVVSKARRGEEREESDVGVLVLCGGLPPSLRRGE